MQFEPVEKAVLDTSVLLNALLINYSMKVNPKDTICYEASKLFPDKKLRKYSELLKNVNQFVTTSQAIGELLGLYNSKVNVKGELKIKFWKLSIEYLKNKKLDEQLIDILSVSNIKNLEKMFYTIDYVDTGLINLAMKMNLDILSEDTRTLRPFAENMLINVIVPSEIIN